MTLEDLPQTNVAVQVQAQEIPIFGVEVLGQDVPFGGVLVVANDDTIQIDFGRNGSGGAGNLVTSVFTRIGDVVALRSDYAAFYQPLDQDLTQIADHGLPWINVIDHGAVADDSTDNTAAFNASLALAAAGQTVFVPPGTYVVNGDIIIPDSKLLVGSGRSGTIIHVKTDTQTTGLITVSAASTLRNIVITYDQPDHAGYTAVPPLFQTFVQYKPAIYIDSFPSGCTVENIRIIKAWDGIKSLNGGRSYLRNIEMSMFNHGFDWDGALDTVRVENVHVWPFGLTSDQSDAFHLPGRSVVFYIGRCDGLHISNLMAINGGGVDAHIGTGGDRGGGPAPPNIYFTACTFDSNSAIQWSAGAGFFDNCFFSSAQPAAQNTFVLTDGVILISNSRFFGGATGGFLQVNGGEAQLSNCRFDSVKWKDLVGGVLNDQPSIAQTAGSLQVNGSYFDRAVDTDYTTPFINVTGGYAAISNNFVEDKGTGSGVFLNLTSSDPHHIVTDNKAIGWTINWPASSSATIAAFGNQLSALAGSAGQNQSLGVRQLYLEGGSASNLRLLSGSGSPEGVVTADPGSLYLDTSISSAGNYAKKTGTGNTGWVATGTGGGGSGTTILDGVGPPDPALGAVDDYYVDVSGGDLYGPRIDVSAADYVSPSSDTTSTGAYEIGGKFRFDVAGVVTGIRYFYPNVTPALGYIVSLWDATGSTLMAQKTATLPIQNAWNVLNFDAPVAVLANHTYVASIWISGLSFSYPASYTGPIVSGHVRALANGEDGPAAYYNTSHAYPTIVWTSFPPMSPMFTLGAAWTKSITGFDEAPVDGTTYGRKNAAWAAVAGGTGGSTSLHTYKIAYVDASGSNSTGTVGDFAKPFLTVQAALNAINVLSPNNGTDYLIDIGNNIFTENLTSPLTHVYFRSSNNDNSQPGNSIILSNTGFVRLYLNGAYLPTITASAASTLSVALTSASADDIVNSVGQIFVTSTDVYSSCGNVTAAGNISVSYVQSIDGNVTASAGVVQIYNFSRMQGTVSNPGREITIGAMWPLVQNSSAGYRFLPIINSAGSTVWAVHCLLDSVLAAGTLHLIDSRVLGTNAAGSTVTSNVWFPTGGAGATEVWSGTDAPVPLDNYLLWIDTDEPTPVGGVGGGDLNFVFNQLAPSSSWAVAHNLGKFPSVSVVDSGGTEIIPSVLYVDNNNVTISFGAATSGKAYIN